MTMNDRCPVCDRPEATAEQWARVERDGNIPAAEGASVCWGEGEPQCTMARVDWRARALAAEAERDEARRLLAAAARGELPRCDECPHAATQRMPSGDGWDHHACDAHAGHGWHDLPHAAALRAAIGGAK